MPPLIWALQAPALAFLKTPSEGLAMHILVAFFFPFGNSQNGHGIRAAAMSDQLVGFSCGRDHSMPWGGASTVLLTGHTWRYSPSSNTLQGGSDSLESNFMMLADAGFPDKYLGKTKIHYAQCF